MDDGDAKTLLHSREPIQVRGAQRGLCTGEALCCFNADLLQKAFPQRSQLTFDAAAALGFGLCILSRRCCSRATSLTKSRLQSQQRNCVTPWTGESRCWFKACSSQKFLLHVTQRRRGDLVCLREPRWPFRSCWFLRSLLQSSHRCILIVSRRGSRTLIYRVRMR